MCDSPELGELAKDVTITMDDPQSGERKMVTIQKSTPRNEVIVYGTCGGKTPTLFEAEREGTDVPGGCEDIRPFERSGRGLRPTR